MMAEDVDLFNEVAKLINGRSRYLATGNQRLPTQNMLYYSLHKHERKKPMDERGKTAADEVFGCIPHGCGACAAARNENYCGNLLW